jgi:N-acetylmuramoyl-L-alanine amidase
MPTKTNSPKFFKALVLTAIIGFIAPAIAMLPRTNKDGTVKKVVIDAGHGGRDTGNLGTGRYKSKEKDISLEVALMVGNYIKENIPDVEVIYTRSNDTFVEPWPIAKKLTSLFLSTAMLLQIAKPMAQKPL